jgi:O-antigen ligase
LNSISRQIGATLPVRDEQLRKQWPLWTLALIVYVGASFYLLTKMRVPTPLHLVVMLMAVAILFVTLVRIEWGIMALAMVFPFSRPGVSIGPQDMFHISAFNVALVGVLFAYVMRYLGDPAFREKRPFLRRTPLDGVIAVFASLVIISVLASFNLGHSTAVKVLTLADTKELILNLAWFYLIVTLLRTPQELRQFVTVFAIGGLLAALYGLASRLSGGSAAVTQGTITTDLGGGAGGRLAGGWLGIDHPNMFAAMLLMTVPFWLFAVLHIRHGIRRIMAELAVMVGFLGLLFTYSRSAWIGSLVGMGLAGLTDRRSLARIIVFGIVFALAAQAVMLVTMNLNVVDAISSRFEDLESTGFSSRPEIYASALAVIEAHPWLGVGLGAFREHAPTIRREWVASHAHNVFLSFASEAGIPAALAFILLLGMIFRLAFRSLRASVSVPGYGFIALGATAGLVGLSAQMMAVQIFRHDMIGYGFYTLVAIVVVTHRMVKNGEFERLSETTQPGDRRAGAWIG